MAASICVANKLAPAPVMRCSFSKARHLARLYLHSVESRCDVVRCVRNFSTSTVKLGDDAKGKQSTPTNANESPRQQKLDVFDEMVFHRKRQARASVVVEVSNPAKSAATVKQACSIHGEVKNLFHYSHNKKELLLLELESEASAASLLESCSHNDTIKVIPALSPFLWLRSMPGSPVDNNLASLEIISDTDPSERNILEQLSQCSSISEQVTMLDDYNRLSESGIRLRWLTCVQIERILSGLFPQLEVYPFGSSVNGCGRNGCDLDMVVSLSGYSLPVESVARSPLVFHAKAALNNARLQTQRHIDVFADLLQHFTTGVTQVQRILQARVPIVKFYHEFTGIDCDLSMSSLSGVYMSEILFLFGEMDSRFRPLVNAVRYWGAVSRLTNPIPGATITNFTLTLLVVFYLQKCDPPILPTLNDMIKRARPDVDRRWVSNEAECTFLRDPTPFKELGQLNEQSLEDLFLGFLRFIEGFPFNDRSISIIWGEAQRKLDSRCPLHVQNPLDRELNVSKNVSAQELTRLTMEARNALFQIENYHSGTGNKLWGLLALSRLGQSETAKRKASLQWNSQLKLDLEDIFLTKEEELIEVKSKPQSNKVFNAPKASAEPASQQQKDSTLNGFIDNVHRRAKQQEGNNNSAQVNKPGSARGTNRAAQILKSRWK